MSWDDLTAMIDSIGPDILAAIVSGISGFLSLILYSLYALAKYNGYAGVRANVADVTNEALLITLGVTVGLFLVIEIIRGASAVGRWLLNS